MEIFTIGFTQSSAERFFGRLREARIERLLDVRLQATSQLAGFAKQQDLAWFLRELLGVEYEHVPQLAPDQELFETFKRRDALPWETFEERFLALLRERRIEQQLDPRDFEHRRTVLLCSEATAEHCHRRLVVEYLAEHWPAANVRAVHL